MFLRFLLFCILSTLASCSLLNEKRDLDSEGDANGPDLVFSRFEFIEGTEPCPECSPLLNIYLKNIGDTSVYLVYAKIDGYDDDVFYNEISPGQEKDSYSYELDYFNLWIPPDATPGTSMEFTLLITGTDANETTHYHWEDTFSIEVQ